MPGHRRGAVAGRCVVPGKIVETEEIPAYCAVALAGLGDLPDTILSRSIIVRMRRRAPREHVEAFRRRKHAPEGHKLHDRLSAWAEGKQEALADTIPDMPSGVDDRDADVWEPLLAIADAVGGKWPKLSRVAAVALVALSKEGTPSLGIRLLSNIRRVFGDDEARSTQSLLALLHDLDESPWGDIRGKPLDDRGLTARLRKYHIRPKVVRLGEATPRGYASADFVDTWDRYLPLPPIRSATSATSATQRPIS